MDFLHCLAANKIGVRGCGSDVYVPGAKGCVHPGFLLDLTGERLEPEALGFRLKESSRHGEDRSSWSGTTWESRYITVMVRP